MAYAPLIENILAYLVECQTPEGEFRSQCYLPGAEEPQWYYSGPSPFLTANIAWCLHCVDHPQAQKLLLRALDFLDSRQERFGLWRYWEHHSPIMEYNVPCDIDDTCLVSWLLAKYGRKVPDNRDLIQRNFRPDGNIDTWFLPRWRNLARWRAWWYLLGELWTTRAIFLPNRKIPEPEPISRTRDAEAAVECHALLYLGQNATTQPTVSKLLREAAEARFQLQYYDRPHFVYYHLSRLIPEGFSEFQAVKPAFVTYVDSVLNANVRGGEDHLQWVMCALTMGNFGWWDDPRTLALLTGLAEDPMLKHGWRAYKYWTSKQRSWWAGSPELTAALYLEGFELLRRREAAT
ncbi:MAG: hypothetical protein AAGN35_09200 [Bacteroidota bacterium]